MPSPRIGEVWLVRFPFTDLRSAKLRPALVLAVHDQDAVVVGIFSRVPAGTLRKTWLLMDANAPSFQRTGLMKTSVLKAEKIAVVHQSVFQRKLGKLAPDLLAQVRQAVKRALLLS
ncbi:MAG: MazF family transcriptional regulator [Armatimonadetes bacterium CG_4_10_14_3_um_filter_66_18]|nr:type II toxin-antitoxin system PemK/MazF family toxin [Armatimonadota bacterium]OIO95297.1 MAG: MazF family transcriptional regulator [Armatimonadetes bacterium CG2_30_66_41]PIU89797.1 MAG: MazF family transcriptional regulator [Armatimonadetes bacterium CG06_land_8_20_14_3_00_66_21]PIX38013.1 MAG: MazF family transcriptional regulator [Armatimonadetes bacterium CG_4_8_14_3_um_filter_66_20]PIY50780.1 MAG: MazF family transcriptional regulator [Armatimonadetes bacterium CG_4_10_14_3_um_filter